MCEQTLRKLSNSTSRHFLESFAKFILLPLTPTYDIFWESAPYPRTSVGNNLSDLAKRHPEMVYKLVKELVDSGNKHSYWIAYRACRNLVKQEPIRLMNILKVDEYKYKQRVHRRCD